MHIIDIIVFLLFTGGVVAFGCSFFKKKGTSEEFTSAGRSLPGWVVGMSIFATYVSSISYLDIRERSFREIGMHLYSVFLFLSPLICGSLLCAFLPESGQHIGL